VDLRYEAYCFADRHFYDIQSTTETSVDDFSRELPAVPEGWSQAEKNIWRHLHPSGTLLPKQGWKIHVSATVLNAGRVLKTTYDYCVEHRIPFKYLRTQSIVLARNSKYAPREASGKLITLYPADDAQLERVLEELGALLDGEVGAYVLSDLRYGAGPLYVRYGGFVEQWLEQDGRRVLAIEGPDGELVPDQRKPNFWVPEWVELPPFLVPHLAARNGGDPDEFPYDVVRSLHFSNGGGVYLATRKADGAEVVLKEARPHAGLDRENVDAVTRLDREHQILTKLDGIPGVPQVYDRFTVWEHHFLAMEYMPGRPLGQWLGMHYPLTHHEVTEDQLVEYRDRALAVVADVERTLAALHERGVVFADLHALNILMDDEDRMSLIDFELSFPIESPRKPSLGAPGFQAPPDREGFEIDEYPLAALRLWLFLPLNEVLDLAPSRLPSHVDFIQRKFGLSDEYCEPITRVLTPRVDVPPAPERTALDEPEPNWRAVYKDIATAILASATPERLDRLFPGDIEQFEVGGACFGFGAAGVLHALHASGQGRFPEYERWLVDSVRREPPKQPGFYTGAHGIAYVLENFAHHDLAGDLVTEYAKTLSGTVDHGLGSGLSGVALNLLHFADTRQDSDFETQAVALGERLGLELQVAAGPGPKAKAGLLHGWSGPALLFLRLFERTGDRQWLGLSEQALDRDLAECMVALDGSTQVRDGGFRTLPYVEIGGAGIAMVLNEFARHAPDAESVTRLPDLLRGCAGEFVIHPGLVLGRAGLLATLAQAVRLRPDPFFEEAIRRHLAALAWHAVPYRDGLAFPGMQLRRLSMDLNTGGAGVLLALASVVDGDASVLPFLGVQPTP
jgi:tRNA A-37 threonylcarbamoyl transferase component Bud32